MRKRLFIVCTPLQLFYAYEAMQRFSVEGEVNDLIDCLYGVIRVL